jgi:hypothetical protein
MSKSLLIIPGTGDPNHPKYIKVYELLKTHALNQGYIRVIIPTLFGHESHEYKEHIHLTKNAELVSNEITILESLQQPYDVICRSYGCSVFFEFYRLSSLAFSNLNRVIMWGPSPYYIYYKFGLKQIENFAEKGKLKGSILNEQLFKTMYPFELHVKEFNNDIDLTIATGTLDHYCSEAYLNYLKNDNPDKKISFQILDNLPHAVEQENKPYLDLLFK